MERQEHPARPSLIALSALFVLAAGLVLAQSSRGGPQVRASARLQLVADLQPTTAKQGAPVYIRLRLKNIDVDTVWLVDNGDYHEYGFTVTDVFGRQPQQTQFGRSLPEMPILRSTDFALMRGHEEKATLDLTKLYTLTPGRYHVQAFRQLILPAADDERAFSNQIDLTIVE